MKSDNGAGQPCRPPNSQMIRMMGRGIPISHNNSPRATVSSPVLFDITVNVLSRRWFPRRRADVAGRSRPEAFELARASAELDNQSGQRTR
jgi:hypothetical protein